MEESQHSLVSSGESHGESRVCPPPLPLPSSTKSNRVCAEGHWEPKRTVSPSVLPESSHTRLQAIIPPALRPDSTALPPFREDDCGYEDWGHTCALFQFQSLVTHHLPCTETSGNLSANEHPAVAVFRNVTQPSSPSALAGEGRRAAGKNWRRSFVTQGLPKLTGKNSSFMNHYRCCLLTN